MTAKDDMFAEAKKKLQGATPEEIDKTFEDKVKEVANSEIAYVMARPDMSKTATEVSKSAPVVPHVEQLPQTPTPVVESEFVVFTEVEKDGFVWKPTFRKGITPKEIDNVILLMNTATTKFKNAGFSYHETKRGGGSPKKEVEYVQGRVCPKDGAKLTVGAGKVKEKCENNKWSRAEGKNVGSCDFIVWNQ